MNRLARFFESWPAVVGMWIALVVFALWGGL